MSADNDSCGLADSGGFEDQPVPETPGLLTRLRRWFYEGLCVFVGKKLMAVIRGNEYLSAVLLEDPPIEIYLEAKRRKRDEFLGELERLVGFGSYLALKHASDKWERSKKERGEPLMLTNTDTSGTYTCRARCPGCMAGDCAGDGCLCNTMFKSKIYKETKI